MSSSVTFSLPPHSGDPVNSNGHRPTLSKDQITIIISIIQDLKNENSINSSDKLKIEKFTSHIFSDNKTITLESFQRLIVNYLKQDNWSPEAFPLIQKTLKFIGKCVGFELIEQDCNKKIDKRYSMKISNTNQNNATETNIQYFLHNTAFYLQKIKDLVSSIFRCITNKPTEAQKNQLKDATKISSAQKEAILPKLKILIDLRGMKKGHFQRPEDNLFLSNEDKKKIDKIMDFLFRNNRLRDFPVERFKQILLSDYINTKQWSPRASALMKKAFINIYNDLLMSETELNKSYTPLFNAIEEFKKKLSFSRANLGSKAPENLIDAYRELHKAKQNLDKNSEIRKALDGFFAATQKADSDPITLKDNLTIEKFRDLILYYRELLPESDNNNCLSLELILGKLPNMSKEFKENIRNSKGNIFNVTTNLIKNNNLEELKHAISKIEADTNKTTAHSLVLKELKDALLIHPPLARCTYEETELQINIEIPINKES